MWDYKILRNVFAIISIRYIIIAGVAFLIWYIWLKKKIAYKKIQLRFPRLKDYKREIIYSIITMAIFSIVPFLLLGNKDIRKHTTYYTDIYEHSMLYFWLAFPLLLLIHDTYFYWTHRLMHHPALFKIFHLLHHKSTNPTPWTSFAFHPLEAVVEVSVIVVFLFTIPITQFHLFFFFLFMMLYNVYGHLGWELLPKNFHRTAIGKWMNTSINHNQHHQYFRGNYGLYFLWWDRWMHTIRDDYDECFDEVKNRKE